MKHLSGQLMGTTDNQMFLVKERELEQARDVIRSLNSQNSELRSKLEVLSSNTRECSETRSNSSEEIQQEDMAETSFSESSSSESFEELSAEKQSTPAAPSSDSFVNVKEIGTIEETIINTTGGDLYLANLESHFFSRSSIRPASESSKFLPAPGEQVHQGHGADRQTFP